MNFLRLTIFLDFSRFFLNLIEKGVYLELDARDADVVMRPRASASWVGTDPRERLRGAKANGA